MSKDNLVDGHVSEKQCKLAVDALLDHASKVQEKKAETQLLPGKEQNLWLVVTVKQMHPEKKLKPAKIPIVHPIVDPRTSSVCLITKDPQREYKDLLESHKIRFISRVVGIAKLKGKFKPFEARRLLLKENDLFLADERVVPLLPGLLGRKFFEAKKQPIPVCLTRKDLKGELERAISSTYFHQNQGTCTSIKIGTVSQTPSQILDNLKAALPAVVKHIKGEWDNIQSFHIKTNSSASLPIWSCNLGGEEGARWDGLTAGVSSQEESDGDDSEVDAGEEVDKAAVTGKKVTGKMVGDADELEASKERGKRKKRAAEEEVTKPQKKAKAEPVRDVAEDSAKPKKKTKTTATTDASLGIVASSGHSLKEHTGLESASIDMPTKKTKKRKADSSQSSATDTSAPATKAIDSPDVSMHSEVLTGPSTIEGGTTPGKKSKKKKALSAAVADAGPSVERTGTQISASIQNAAEASPLVEPKTPVTPVIAKKKSRASAVDFFEEERSVTTPAAPPNTPADGLAVQTPSSSTKGKKKARFAEEASLSNSVAKLVNDSEQSIMETPVKSAADAALDKKSKKRKSTGGDGSHTINAPTGTPPAKGSSLTKEELKKKRSLAGVEKKKEKVVNSAPAAKSAKDAIVGKKRS